MSQEETFAYVTTVGWKTGRHHTIEIWYVMYEDCCYLVAEGRDNAHWVRNIRHHPTIWYAIGTRTQRESEALTWNKGTGRTLAPSDDPHRVATVSALMSAKYGWSDGLLVELCPA